LFKDPSGKLNGYIWFYVAEVIDGKGKVAGRKIIAIYDDSLSVREINPAVLWDLLPSRDQTPIDNIPDKDKVLPYVIASIERYKQDVLKERQRQAKIKEKYGLKSLDYLICDLDAQLAELYERQASGGEG